MTKHSLVNVLGGTDLRSVGRNGKVVLSVRDQESFDELFTLIFHHERPLVMKAVDAVEKITLKHPEFLKPHKEQLMAVLRSADHKELKWHIAQLVTRVELTDSELADVRHILSYWALNRNESRIVRVNALQGLFDLSINHPQVKEDVLRVMGEMQHELIPSIQARVRKLRRML